MGTPVQRAALLRGRRAGRPLLAIADDRDPGGVDPVGDQVLPRGLSPPLAEGEIVLRAAGLVAVPFDDESRIGVRAEPAGDLVENGLVARLDVEPVDREVNVPGSGGVAVCRPGRL